jgi:hypothetical protein
MAKKFKKAQPLSPRSPGSDDCKKRKQEGKDRKGCASKGCQNEEWGRGFPTGKLKAAEQWAREVTKAPEGEARQGFPLGRGEDIQRQDQSGPPKSGASLQDLKKNLHKFRIQNFSGHLLHDLSRLLFGVGLAVGPVRNEGMPNIGYGNDS